MLRIENVMTSVVGCAALLMGCGGAAPEPETPVQAAPEPAPIEEAAPEPEADAEAVDEAPTEQNGQPASREDIQAALQLVLHDEALIQKMDLGVAGRFPVKISGADIPQGLELMAHEKGAEIIPLPEDPKKDPVLAFTKIDIIGKKGVLKFRYDVEGLRGTATVEKVGDRWELKSSRVSEYFRKAED